MIYPSKLLGIGGVCSLKLSTKGRYGLRAIVDLAANSRSGAVCISSIAQRQNLSESYLEQLMSLLRKAGIIESVRGAGGGYRLARAPEQISVGEILRALEGDLNLVECSALMGEGQPCAAEETCVTKYVWQRITKSINQTVDEIFLAELLKEGNCAQGAKRFCESGKGE